jgi:hypothetical protein
MPKWNFHGRIDDDDFEFDEDFDIDESYTGFQKIERKNRYEEEVKGTKKKSSVKHQKRPDKDT